MSSHLDAISPLQAAAAYLLKPGIGRTGKYKYPVCLVDLTLAFIYAFGVYQRKCIEISGRRALEIWGHLFFPVFNRQIRSAYRAPWHPSTRHQCLCCTSLLFIRFQNFIRRFGIKCIVKSVGISFSDPVLTPFRYVSLCTGIHPY